MHTSGSWPKGRLATRKRNRKWKSKLDLSDWPPDGYPSESGHEYGDLERDLEPRHLLMDQHVSGRANSCEMKKWYQDESHWLYDLTEISVTALSPWLPMSSVVTSQQKVMKKGYDKPLHHCKTTHRLDILSHRSHHRARVVIALTFGLDSPTESYQ